MCGAFKKVCLVFLCFFILSSCSRGTPKKFHKRVEFSDPHDSRPLRPEPRGDLLDESSSEAIGYYSNGRMTGDYQLSEFDGNFELVNAFRNRHWAHARMLNFLAYFSDRLLEEGVEWVKVSDVSKEGGGSLRPSHVSHQVGLDMDIWLANGEDSYQEVVVSSRVDEALFERFQARKLYKAAVEHPHVQRVFVNYAIKQHLCRTEGETAWLRKLRPISGHTGHLHVRMYCTEYDAHCQAQGGVAPGSGCSEVLSPDFDPYFFVDEIYALDQRYFNESTP